MFHKAILAALVLVTSFARAASPSDVDTVTIRYRNAVSANAALSFAQQSSLTAAFGRAIAQVSASRDGAFVVTLDAPMSIEDARRALAGLRESADVLYANASSPSTIAQTRAIAQAAASDVPSVPQLIVKYRDTPLAAGATLASTRLARIASLAAQPVALVRTMGGGESLLALMTKLTRAQAETLARTVELDPDVEYADPDYPVYPLLTPSDPYFGNQWDFWDAVGGINAPAAWNVTTGSASIYVGVIDTGIRPHEDLTGRFVGGYDFISSVATAGDGDGRDPDATDPGDWVTANQCSAGSPAENSSWHGMHVSGTIAAAANNGVGIAGINWVSRVVPLRVLGKCGGSTSDIADAIRWGAGLSVVNLPTNAFPVRVENLSLGGTGACGTTLQNAINAALGAGTVVVVAAGNENQDAANVSPASCNGVVTVAASARSGGKTSYSNFGTTVEIAAPGGGDTNYIYSTINAGTQGPAGDTYAWYAGTSMATPHVTGVASLMLSLNPSLTPAQVLSKLQSSARPFPVNTGNDCTTSLCGAGLLDAGAAVVAAGAAHLYEGFVDGADCSTLAGWAWDQVQPNTAINVDVYRDNVLLTTVAASNFRSDLLNAGKGNGAHGFSLATPSALQDGQAHSVAFRFSGTSTDLTLSPRTLTCGTPTAQLTGFTDQADCSVVSGWAWDANQPNTPINVDVYSDGAYVATTPANAYRSDLAAAGIGNGVHSFTLATPPALLDGQAHSIDVRYGGTARDLYGVPRVIACTAIGAPAYVGFHDEADCTAIAGWAYDQNRPNAAIDVDLYADGAYLLSLPANAFRGDLLAAGIGNGAHAFSLATPASLKDGRTHALELRYGGTGSDLYLTPRSIACTS